ncbi:MAG: hypothetical protein H6835_03165 [Planctomycetes bacterium]|nr:hypothetical protein [Planctomycetota bacterium]
MSMQSGSSVYRDLERQTVAAQDRLNSATQQVEQARAALQHNRSEEARALAELARVRLGELGGDRVKARLDQSDRDALALLAERTRERDRVGFAVADGAAALAALRSEQDRLAAARDAAAKAHEELVAATMQQLAQQDEWAAQRGHVEFTAAKAQNAADKAQQAAADRDHKRAPYDADKLFAYLWRRRYRFPEYRAIPLIRTLDGWVAGLCDYDRAHRDYGMLLEIPKRLAAHAAALQAEAAAELARLTALERAALDAAGEPARREALQAAQQQLEELGRRIVAAEAAQDELLQQQASLASGQDRWSASAEQVLQAQLASEDVATLRADALATESPRDDELVWTVASVRERALALSEQLRAAEQAHHAALTSFREVEDLSRRFRQHDFQRGDSMFDDDFDVGSLVGGVLAGVLRSGDAWSTMRRRQRWRARSSDSAFGTAATIGRIGGAILGSIGSSSSRGGFGGGGGGFRSGGGFGGGGGGFRTGGGF